MRLQYFGIVLALAMPQNFIPRKANMSTRLTNISTLLIAIAILSGCATTPMPSAQAEHIPAERQLGFRSATSGTVPVIITRDSGFMSSACATLILVNGTPAAYVRAGEKVTLNIPVGDTILGAQPDGICAGGLVEVEAKLQAGKPNNYRIGYDQNGSLGLYRTAIR